MMQLFISLRILGLMLSFFSLSYLPALAVALWYEEPEVGTFLWSAVITFSVGFPLWYYMRWANQELRIRDGFLIIVLTWAGISLFAALPFIFSPALSMTFAEAVFEATSGLTTTGATVLVGIENLPRVILYYRQQLHFLGGMGILVIAVAVLPMLGIGGLQLFRTEVSGTTKDSKLTPRVTQTARALWVVYIILTMACIIAYWLGGMSLFDAVCFGFSTISTGGFAPYDASFVYPEVSLRLIAVFFMILGALNFSLHFLSLRHGKVLSYFHDEEVRVFFAVQIIATILCLIVIFKYTTITDPLASFVDVLFQVVSIGTTTGFTVASFHLWPLFVPILLMFVALIGGCSGSTAGGIKPIRVLLILKQSWREINRLIHPNGYFLLKVNQTTVSTRVSDAVWGFMGVYVSVCLILTLLLMALGLDFTSAFSGVVGTLTTLGPGLGTVALHYGDVSEMAKWVFTLAMLLGRLELFSILILLTPAFWRN